MDKKAQQAMEYLITHGWMIMVTIMVASAAVYLGIFDNDNLIPQQCMMSFDFGCGRYVVQSDTTDGSMRVELSNQLGEPINVDNFTFRYPDGVNYCSVDTTAYPQWDPGDTLEFYCTKPTPLPSNKKIIVEMHMVYKKITGGFSKSVTGQMTVNVVET